MGRNLTIKNICWNLQIVCKSKPMIFSYYFQNRFNLQRYLKLATSMTRNTLIEHLKTIIICEESGLTIVNDNALLTQP